MIVVIGGSGFIGTRLIKRLMLDKKMPVKIVDKSPSTTFSHLYSFGDVTSLANLRDTIPDNSIIVNLAAEHRDDILPVTIYDKVNIGGAINICKIAREKSIKKIIFTSSVAVYGFAAINTGESGLINPFNDYGRTKFEAEKVFKSWQQEAPTERTLVIIRPTVVFGEKNRGNVYNLLRLIDRGKFIMIGDGENRKSMAYVENIAAFIEYCINFDSGIYIYNYVDKPDFTMNDLVLFIRKKLQCSQKFKYKIPYAFAYSLGKGFDIFATVLGRRFLVSSIRVKKFCTNSVYSTAIEETGFIPPVSLKSGLENTINYEFINNNNDQDLFFTE